MGVYLGQSVYNDSQVTPQWVDEEVAKNGKGVFFATYGQTSSQDIRQEYNKGKTIVCKYEPSTPGEVTTYYLNLVRFDTETFDFVGVMDDGTIYKTSINVNEGWDNVTTIPPMVVDAVLNSSSHNPVENMAIAAELTAINNKITGDLNDIFLALASKGVTVPAGAGLDDVAGLIDDIQTGGEPPAPSGYKNLWGLTFTNGSEQYRMYQDDRTPDALIGKYNKDVILEATITTKANAFTPGEYICFVRAAQKSRTELYIGADSSGNYVVGSNNDYWNDSATPLIALGSGFPITESFTFHLTTHKTFFAVSVKNYSNSTNNAPYWEAGQYDPMAYIMLCPFPRWQGMPYYLNNVTIRDASTNAKLFDANPVEEIGGQVCRFYDSVNNILSNSSGLDPN